ncbi:MAG: alkaline phosphatase, partial [Planctomycetes bacterium]|nr:alkaline phosphatase [Planctomycetota bacterium]
YVFFFIGDGMGKVQVEAANKYVAAMSEDGKRELNFKGFPVKGEITTHSHNNKVTDSAAAGTALATGNKTNNGMLGIDAASGKPFETVAEKAKKQGMKVGIVTTVSIDHATPASFYAHVKSRNSYGEISRLLGDSGFDFFAAGGMKGAKGPDGKSNAEYATSKGYTLVTGAEELKAAEQGGKVIAFSSHPAAAASIPYVIDRKDGGLTLPLIVSEGIRLLDNDNGFFMMVEGGKIDWACHGNDLASAVKDIVDMDDAVAVAVDFMKKHPDETLIIVTADHETGGLEPLDKGGDIKALDLQTISQEDFNQEIKPYKKEKEDFEKVFPYLSKSFGLNAADAAEKEAVKNAWNATIGGSGVEEKLLYGSKVPVTITCLRIITAKAGYRFTSFDHSGAPVGLWAAGAGADLFSEKMDNTDVPKKIAALMAE